MTHRLVLIAGAIVGLAFTASVQGSPTVLIRNSNCVTLDPPTPPNAERFDSTTGALLGEHIPQPYAYSFHTEAIENLADGLLVFYQLDDPEQTLFMSTYEGRVVLTSFRGRCRLLDASQMLATINTIPSLSLEYEHANYLFGLISYSGGVVCDDAVGTLSVQTLPVAVAADRSVALLFLRDEADEPLSYIQVAGPSRFEYYSVNGGGLRYDETDPQVPMYVALGGDGDQAAATFSMLDGQPTCEEVGLAYHDCLTRNAEWSAWARDLASVSLSTAMIRDNCWLAGASPQIAFQCAGIAGIGFSALIVSGTLGLLDCQDTLQPATCPPAPGYSPECLGGATCHLNFGHGHPYCTFAPPVPNTCTPSRTCGGPGHCNDYGQCWTDPNPPEICDNYDNDCDGTVDGFATTCGHGACAAAGTCTNGTDSCTPGAPAAEACDGIDNDCNGSADDTGDVLCSDDNTCTGLETCSGSAGCQPGVLLDCNDGNLCTDDSCDPGSGCVHTPNSAPCDDGDACTTNDACSGGFCVGGVPMNCIDPDPCTADSCDPATGCTHTIISGCSANSTCLQVGGGGWVEAPDSPTLDVSGDITIEFWAYIVSGTPCKGGVGTCFPVVSKWRDGGYNDRAYFVDARAAGTQQPRFTWGPNGRGYYNLYGPTVMPQNEWHHYAAVRQGTAMLLFIDGAWVASTTCSADAIYNTPQPLRIGRGLLYETDVRAIGQIDEVRIWNVARSQADIQTYPFGLPLPQTGLVGYWTFNEASGVALDLSGNGNDAVFQGDATRVPCAYP